MYQMTREDKANDRYKVIVSDTTSIADYLEKTFAVRNNLFQDQVSVNAMAAELLAEFKDPKWFADLNLFANPVPLELGDTITWVLDLALATGSSLYGMGIYGTAIYGTAAATVTLRGIIRAVDINDNEVRYRCEVSGIESGSVSASP